MYAPELFRKWVADAAKALKEAQEVLDDKWGIPGTADETSLLFNTQGELDSFLKWCSVEGIENFNSVPRDTMRRRDEVGEFDVRFEFLRVPEADWRIEAMCVVNGSAPLHDERIRNFGSGCVIHVSWKEQTLDHYYDTRRALLSEVRIPFYAEYENTYGRFSYWAGPGFYLKPRVNLRDPAN